MPGFKNFRCARIILRGVEIMHMIIKGQMKKGGMGQFCVNINSLGTCHSRTAGFVERERYAASGTVTKGGKLVEASGILGVVDSESEAEHMGLEWSRAKVDNHA